jgi:hypothetical protein
MNGMRVKCTCTFSGGGTSAPLFVTVTGLNDREIPTECDLLVVEVPILCVGVCGVGGNEQVACIVFRNGHDTEKFEFYLKNGLTIYQLSPYRICIL